MFANGQPYLQTIITNGFWDPSHKTYVIYLFILAEAEAKLIYYLTNSNTSNYSMSLFCADLNSATFSNRTMQILLTHYASQDLNSANLLRTGTVWF